MQMLEITAGNPIPAVLFSENELLAKNFHEYFYLHTDKI